MTSIFSHDYQSLLSRIESNAEAKNAQKTSAKKTGESFAKILGDLEKLPEKKNDSNNLAESSTAPRAQSPALSNLSPEERVYSRARMSGYQSIANGPKIPVDKAVKEQELGVKSTPPSLPLPQLGQAPSAAPTIISAKRIPYTGIAPTQSRSAAVTSEAAIRDIVSTAGKFHGVDPSLTLAIAKAESSFQPTAVSSDGHDSKGIFQLLDSTAHEMIDFSQTQDDYDPFDPAMSAYLGVGYLRRLLDMFSEPTALSSRTSTIAAKNADELEKFAVAAFNAGQGAVARAQAEAVRSGLDPSQFSSVEAFLPASTQEYVARVSRHKEEFAQAELGSKKV